MIYGRMQRIGICKAGAAGRGVWEWGWRGVGGRCGVKLDKAHWYASLMRQKIYFSLRMNNDTVFTIQVSILILSSADRDFT